MVVFFYFYAYKIKKKHNLIQQIYCRIHIEYKHVSFICHSCLLTLDPCLGDRL